MCPRIATCGLFKCPPSPSVWAGLEAPASLACGPHPLTQPPAARGRDSACLCGPALKRPLTERSAAPPDAGRLQGGYEEGQLGLDSEGRPH